MENGNHVLQLARQRAESRAAIMQSLSAAFGGHKGDKTADSKAIKSPDNNPGSKTKGNGSNERSKGVGSNSGDSHKIIQLGGVKRKAEDAVGNFSSTKQGTAQTASSTGNIRDANSHVASLIMSFVEHAHKYVKSEHSTPSTMTSASQDTTLNISQRNRIQEYLQDQLPNKAISLDNARTQTQATKAKSRVKKQLAQHQQQAVHKISQRKLYKHCKKRTKRIVQDAHVMDDAALQDLHMYWQIYMSRLLMQSSASFAQLQARLYTQSELIGARVQVFHNQVSHRAVKQRHRGSRQHAEAAHEADSASADVPKELTAEDAEDCKSSNQSKTDDFIEGQYGILMQMTTTCYYVVPTTEDLHLPNNSEDRRKVLCIHKAACNLVVFLPSEQTASIAYQRLRDRRAEQQLQQQRHGGAVKMTALESDDEDDDPMNMSESAPVDGDDDSSVAMKEGDDTGADRGIKADQSSTTISDPDKSKDFTKQQQQQQQRVFVLFGAYFDTNKKRRREFPYVQL